MAKEQVLNSPELTSVIIQCLKSSTLEEKGIRVVPEIVPNIPRSWTTIFARLATVNRAFLNASIDVLWENMTSLVPLFANVLPADRDEKGAVKFPLSYHDTKITSGVWKRFEMYSPRIKVLYSTNANSYLLAQGWFINLHRSGDRPKILLPGLQGVHLATDDIFLDHITENSAHLKWVEIQVPLVKPAYAVPKHTKALATMLSQRAACLTYLGLAHTITSSDIGCICAIQTVTSLKITVSRTEEDCQSLRQLSRLPRLNRLHVGVEGAATAVEPSRIDVQNLTTRDPQMTLLEHLTVTAQGNSQLSILKALLPTSLISLELVVKQDLFNQQKLNIPLIAAAYANRNPGLTSLILGVPAFECDEPSFIDSAALGVLRLDADLQNLEPFFDAVSKLPLLETLQFECLPVLVIDIVPRILKITERLPGLRQLILFPNAVDPDDSEELIKPNLSVLEEIAMHNPRLTHLQLACDLEGIPRPPALKSTHPLEAISIGREQPDDVEDYEMGDYIRLAQYVGRVFPFTDTVYQPVFEAIDFWGLLSEVLKFGRECRSQA